VKVVAYLSKLADLFGETTNLRVVDVSRIFCEHVEHHRIDFAWQGPHDGECCHVESYSSSSSQLVLIDLVPATNDIARTARSLHDDCKTKREVEKRVYGCGERRSLTSFGIELSKHFTNDLSHALKGLQIILRLVVRFSKLLQVLSHCGKQKKRLLVRNLLHPIRKFVRWSYIV
jgi:hypothetical protein